MLNKFTILVISLILVSCCEIYYGINQIIGYKFYGCGKRYFYSEFTKDELKSSINELLLNNVHYFIPFDFISNYNDYIFSSVYNHLRIEEYADSNIEYNYDLLLIDEYGKISDHYSFYLEQEHLILSIRLGSGSFDSTRNSYWTLICFYSIGYLNSEKGAHHHNIPCSEKYKMEKIFEDEILTKLDSILRRKYPNKKIDW